MPRNGTAGSWGRSAFSFLRNPCAILSNHQSHLHSNGLWSLCQSLWCICLQSSFGLEWKDTLWWIFFMANNLFSSRNCWPLVLLSWNGYSDHPVNLWLWLVRFVFGILVICYRLIIWFALQKFLIVSTDFWPGELLSTMKYETNAQVYKEPNLAKSHWKRQEAKICIRGRWDRHFQEGLWRGLPWDRDFCRQEVLVPHVF